MRGHVVSGVALVGFASVLSCDLFHDTTWATRCSDDPDAEGCDASTGAAGGSGATGSGGAASGSGASSSSASSATGGGEGGGPGASCSDNIQSGNESDVDCGGACPPCADGQSCLGDADCVIGVCSFGVCACGHPSERCCTDRGCHAPLACDEEGTCRLLDLPNVIGCGGCNTPQQLCINHGFAGAVEAYGYWLGQCGGPGACPVGWSGVTCGDWCSGANCVGNNYCGPAYVVASVAAGPNTVLCATDNGGDCVFDNPGYYVRARCQ